LVKTTGGEVWVETASEWEVTEVFDYQDRPKPNIQDTFFVLDADVAFHGNEPIIA
jgi:hypothetical protein